MKRVNWLAVGISVLALLAAAWAIYEPYTVRQEAKSLADQVTEACAKGGPGAAQLGAACAKAAEVKDQTPVAQPAEPDPATLRQAARTAVAEYCAAPSRPCRGVDGASPNFDAIVTTVLARMPAPKDGRDGKDASTPDWAAQVAAYCGQATEPCRGRDGEKGADGKDGQDGKPGAEGPPGPTCPDGYTAQSRRQATETWWVCVADSPSPPTSTN
ncbi:hypothetical protein [Amycolatopsis japonica]